MAPEVKLSQVDEVFATLDYPVTRSAAAEAVGDVTLVYADGRESLGDVLARAPDDSYESADDIKDAVFSVLPIEAVGEPGQSEGEG